MSKDRFSKEINIRNKQASFQYEFIDKFIAGIVLKGTEIKSIREGKVNLQDGYCYLNNEEMFVKGININPYAQGTHYNHEAARERKLLMKKSELLKLEGKVVPLYGRPSSAERQVVDRMLGELGWGLEP